jgi:nitrile hydratase
MSDPSNPVGDYRRLQAAIEELLILKGVVSRAEIEAQVAAMDARDHRRGAKMVARAWVDPGYKARLLANGRAAAEELGIEVGPLHLVVVENTPEVHNVIVCTLCSCYPRALLGMPPDWYKSTAYRARTVREPRAVLAEFGTRIPDGVTVRVHDSTADMRYMVLPMRPDGAEHLAEAELAELVNRDCLVGTRLPDPP